MTRIVTVGAAVQDVFLSNSTAFAPVCINPNTCFEMLELGSKTDVNTIFFSTGGGATNAAVTFARQGIETQFIGSIGNDPAGQAILDVLDQENVNTAKVAISDTHNTGYSVLLIAPSGERTVLTYRGASTHYRAEDMSLEDIQADWLYATTLSGSMSVLSKLFSQAKQAGMKIFFNPGKRELEKMDELKGLLEDVDVLLANKQEMQQMFQGSELHELAMHAQNLVPVTIVTDGRSGVVACDGQTLLRAGLYEDGPVVDQTGAGDAFGSGFLSQWSNGKSLRDSIIFASANASSVVSQMGAKTGILNVGATLHDMPIHEEPLSQGEGL